jgi:hypothetical protein
MAHTDTFNTDFGAHIYAALCKTVSTSNTLASPKARFFDHRFSVVCAVTYFEPSHIDHALKSLESFFSLSLGICTLTKVSAGN